MSTEDDVAFWRGVVASAADIRRSCVTVSSPEGFLELFGQDDWWYVSLGDLVLQHDGKWELHERGETAEERMTFAHKSVHDALTALRRSVAPDEPACAEPIEKIYGKKT